MEPLESSEDDVLLGAGWRNDRIKGTGGRLGWDSCKGQKRRLVYRYFLDKDNVNKSGVIST